MIQACPIQSGISDEIEGWKMKENAKNNVLGYIKYVLILSVFIVIGYTLLYISYENIKMRMIGSLNERQLLHARQAARGIEAFIIEQKYLLAQMAKDKHIINLGDHGKEMMEAYYKVQSGDIIVITRIDEQGRILFPIPYNAKLIGKPTVLMADFESVKRTGRVWVSEVFISLRGVKSIMVQTPVFDGEHFKGTIAVLLPFDTIAKRYVEQIRIRENGYAWVISKEGIELFCPVPGHVGKSVFKNCQEFPDIIAMAHKMIKGEQGVTTYKYNRVRRDTVDKTIKHAVYLPINLGNTFWSIVVATPEDEYMDVMVEFRNRLILIAVLLLFAVSGLIFTIFRNLFFKQEIEQRKQAEAAMLMKTEELDRYFTGSLDLLCIADHEGYFHRLNPEWEKTLGYPLSELIGKRFIDLVHPDDLEATMDAAGQLKKNEQIQSFVNRYRHRNGTYRWIEWRSYPVENRIYAVARDITMRKQMEDELKASQTRLREIIEFLPDATFVIDKEGRVTAWNRAIAEMTGIRAEEIVGQGDHAYTVPFYGERRRALIDLLMEADELFLQEHYQAISKTGNTLSAEGFVPGLKKGEGAYIWITATRLCRDDGEVIGAIESIRDISDRKAMEVALRRVNCALKELSDLLPEAVFETDMDLIITFVNKRAVSLFGYTDQDIEKGIHALKMIVPEQHDRARDIIRRRLGGEFEGPVEYMAVKQDGIRFPVIINTVRVMRDGEPTGLRGVIIDMTERKRAEEQIRLQAMVLDQIQDLITITDLSGNITYVNESQTRMLGYKKEDLIGKNVSYSGEDADQGATQQEIIEKTRTQGVWRGDVINYRADGSEIILDCRTQLVYDESGKSIAMAGFFTDITEKKRLERALDQNRRDLRTAVDATDDMIVMTDAAGHILLYNRVFGELYRNVSDNLTGRNIFELLPETTKEERLSHFEAARAKGIPFFFEDESDGRNWSNAAYPVIGESGGVTRMVLFGRDITERRISEQHRRELEERLQRAEKMEALGLLSGGVAHDLNNVLGVMVGYSELLLNRIEATSPAKSYAEKILQASERAAAVIQDMLTLARRGVQNRHTLNLNTLIIDFLKAPEFLNITREHAGLRVRTQLDAKPLHILGAPVQLTKTVMNLIVNAAEAMPQGGVVTIRTANQYLDRPVSGYDEISEGDYVVLTVSDTGEGISQNDIKHIFEPFYTRKVMGKSGTGLGLSVVWGTVKDHNGYINVESREGLGSTFTLYFPVSREDITVKKLPASLSDYMGKGESILVVDDVEGQRELAQRMLEKLKYQVVTVSSGEEAVEYLKTNRADLIVLDMIMEPGMDGLETYRKIIEIHPDQRAIIVSGFAETERVSQIQALGGGDYVMKPYILETLGMAVKKALTRPKRRNES